MRDKPAASLLDGTEKGMTKVRVAVYLNRKYYTPVGGHPQQPETLPSLEEVTKDLVKVFHFSQKEATELAQEWLG